MSNAVDATRTSSRLLATRAKLGFATLHLRGWEVAVLATGGRVKDGVGQKSQAVHFYSPLWQGSDGVTAAIGNGQTRAQHLPKHIPKWQKAANLAFQSCGLVQAGGKTRGV